MHKLRSHHLICLHFFKGHGFDYEFQKNLSIVLKSISEVEVVDGVDDVCKACPYNVGFCNYSPEAEKEVKELDIFALQKLNLKVGSRVNWKELESKIDELIDDWKDLACKSCDWRGICDV
ncbi:MAG: DUF1284 domain-containing protein [Leptospiraceae bacterium]|nr:DUF1284 domain-containing protein [Leptospiraceae bacterium]